MPREAGRHAAWTSKLQEYGGLGLAPPVQVKAVCMVYKQRTRMASVPTDIGCSWPRMIGLSVR
jgi:hypothetical protein